MQTGTSLAVQWFGFTASNAGDLISIPGRGNGIPQALQDSQKKKGCSSEKLLDKIDYE